tara:strand:- start:3869 stop:4435 length:567 start_codon:yes stop_codon:yes gene_type:complete
MLFIISGPSGVGKGTLINDLIAANANLCLAISATTRTPRPGEIDGETYYYLNNDAFDKEIEDDNFLEWCTVHGNRYGTLKSEISTKLSQFSGIIIEIDVQGAKKLRTHKEFPQYHIFIAPPSEAVLEDRLRQRNTENTKIIQNRLDESKKELEEKKYYDKIIVNNKLTQSLNELNNVILSILTKESAQ